MEQLTVYELEPAQLIDRFSNACARARAANSGLCIDIGGGYHATEVQYLRGALLARLLGRTPPFRPGQKVRMTEEARARYTRWKPYPPDRILTVKLVFFALPDYWDLVFEGYDQFDDGRIRRCPAGQFEAVESEATAS